MKCNIIITSEREPEVLVYSHERNALTEAVERICEEDAFELIGYRDKESIKLKLAEIDCFTVEDNKIHAVTARGKWQLKCRLYHLEETLPDSFVKINQSCIANIKAIERFDASFAGSLTVRFKNGHSDYVSRRNLKKVKERLGL